MANESRRVVIIGGGHNGLVTAFYLARAGYAPVVLERRSIVGGAAVTEEIHPGFRCPSIFHTAGPLLPQVVKDLALENHGLQKTHGDVELVALHPDGRALRIHTEPQKTANELATFSDRDAKNYPRFHSVMTRLGNAIRPLLSVTPPDIDHLKIGDYMNLGRFGLSFRGLERPDAYRLLRWGP